MSSLKMITNGKGLDMEALVMAEMKIVVVGNQGVGKSALIQRFSQHTFRENYTSTIGIDYDCRIFEVDGTFVKMHLWDMSGLESFLWVGSKHIKDADGFIFVYDATDTTSFDAVARWLGHVNRCARMDNLPKVLVGTKSDMRHKVEVSGSQAKEFGIPEGMHNVEVSNMTGKNVNVAFYLLASEVRKHCKLGCVQTIPRSSLPWWSQDSHHDPAAPTKDIEDGPEYAHLFKIMMMGATRTGKTSLRFRFCRDYFSPEYLATAGLEYGTRTVLVDNEKVKVQVWDISGDEVYDQVRKGYYKGANGFIIVFDVCNEESFEKAGQLLKELDMYEQSDVPKILVANKSDVKESRKVDMSDVVEWAAGWRIPLLEVSARNGINVDATFYKLVMALTRQLAPWKRLYNFSQ